LSCFAGWVLLGSLLPDFCQLFLDTYCLLGQSSLLLQYVNTTAPVLAGKIAYVTVFAHFPLSRPTLHSLHSAEPHQPCCALVLSHTRTCTLTPHPPSAHACASHMCFGPHSHTSPSVPLAPPGHVVPSLPTFPVLILVPGPLSYVFSIYFM
jgi:hypothetical protein